MSQITSNTIRTENFLQSYLHRQPTLGKVVEVKNPETARMLEIYNLPELNMEQIK